MNVTMLDWKQYCEKTFKWWRIKERFGIVIVSVPAPSPIIELEWFEFNRPAGVQVLIQTRGFIFRFFFESGKIKLMNRL